MNKKNHVTSLKYIKLSTARQPSFPTTITKVMEKAFPLLVPILAKFLKYEGKSNACVRLPEHMMKLEDGTHLATDVYLPKKALKYKKKCPTILVRLPYWKDNFYFIGYAFSTFGYAVVIQDIRGTAHSEGMNFILIPDRQDGLETLKWLTKQFWYNGKVGMAGGSYFGMTQWCVSWDNDNILTTICPAISSYTNMMRLHGGLGINALLTDFKRILINTTMHRDSPPQDTLPMEQVEAYLNPRAALYNEPVDKIKPKLSHFEGLPLDVIVKFLKRMFKLKELNLSKRNYRYFFLLLDRLLKNIDVNHEKMFGMLELDVTKISQPAFLLAGWYDLFMEHTLKDYLDIKANAKGIARDATRIMIGPIAHAAVGKKTNKFDNGMIDFLKGFIAKEWYDYWLKGIDNKWLHKPPVQYYVMGKDTWRYSNVWPPKKTAYKEFYIHSNGKANSVSGDGTLDTISPDKEPHDYYKFNPMDPVITKGGRNLNISSGAENQKDSEKRRDVLVYTSEPFKDGIEITGPVKMILYASTSAKDTDFHVKLCEVDEKGRSWNLLDAGVRARFRKGEDTQELIEPEKIIKYEIHVGNISNFFLPGYRMRLDVTSSNFPRYDINSNLAGEGEEGEYVIADQKIFHNRDHPSHLIIPIHK